MKTSPAHYADLEPQPLDVIIAWSLPYCLGNVVKYIARAGRKPGESALDDLQKARVYLDREIERLSQEGT